MIMIEVCPLEEDQLLPKINETINTHFNISELTREFRNCLTTCQQAVFDKYEDMVALASYETQRCTVIEVHCPQCRKRHECKHIRK